MTKDCQKTIEASLEILVGKWKPIILFHLMDHGVLRFSELQRLIPGITKKMLTSQLRELEYHRIVHRKVYLQVPPKVEYSITEYGYTLRPVIEEMHKWGEKHLQKLKEWYGEEQLKKEMNKS